MNWDAIGAIGEVLGAIAVIFTLIYLAVQIRQNSASTRAQIRQSLAEAQIEYMNLRATDPFLRTALEKMFMGIELDPDEQFGVVYHTNAGLRMFENYYAQHQFGTLDDEDWRAIREVVKMQLRCPPVRAGFNSLEIAFNSGFAGEVRKMLDEIDRETV